MATFNWRITCLGIVCLLAACPPVAHGQIDPTWKKFEAELKKMTQESTDLKASFITVTKGRLKEYFETDTPRYDRYFVITDETVENLTKRLKKQKAPEAILSRLQDIECVLGIAQDSYERESYYVYLVPLGELGRPLTRSKLQLTTRGGRQFIVRQKVYSRKYGDFDYTNTVSIPLRQEALDRAARAVSTAIQVCEREDTDPFAR